MRKVPHPASVYKTKAQRGAYLVRGILWFIALGMLLWTISDWWSSESTNFWRSRVSKPKRTLVSVALAATAVAASPSAKPKKDVAVIVLCRESEVPDMLKTMASFDEAYNSIKLHDYVIFSDVPWKQESMDALSSATKSRVRFHILDDYAWGMPKWIDRKNFSNVLATQTYYGNTESYRKMCRFFAGPAFTTSILEEYRYAWRLDSHVRYLCDVVDDPIARMDATGALYGYALRMKEKMDTIPSLWSTAEEYAVGKGRKDAVKAQWDVTIPGHSLEVGCHYWNNMEITRLEWFRGPVYQDFFKALDASGGFFYERWGDAPVRTLALLLLAEKSSVIFFDELGYQHPWWIKCPPPSGVCFKKGVALKPGVGEGCIPDPEIQPHTITDGAPCNVGQ